MSFWGKIKRVFTKKKKVSKKPAHVPLKDKTVHDGRIAKVTLHGLVGMTPKQKEFYEDAIELKLTVLNSYEFRDRFLAMRPSERNGYSMPEVLGLILDGKQKFDNIVDYDIDLLITLYGDEEKASKTVGYTYINSIKIYTHRYHVARWMKQRYGAATLAGHIMHEVMHHMGFVHRFSHKGTLVYETGYLVRDLGEKHLKGQKLTPISPADMEQMMMDLHEGEYAAEGERFMPR